MRTEISLTSTDREGSVVTFDQGFTIGRDQTCGLHVDSPLASRVHAAVSLEEGQWWAVDLGSTNGIYVDGGKSERARLRDGSTLQIGRGGITFRVSVSGVAAEQTPGAPETPHQGAGSTQVSEPRPASDSTRVSTPLAESGGTPSMTQVMKRYFDEEGDEEAGEHTRMIRQAYKEAKTRDRRPLWVGFGVLLLALVGTAVGLGLQRNRMAALEDQAQALFVSMRQNDVVLSNFRRALEASSGADFQQQLADLERQRDLQREQYEGYVEQLGFYRRMRNDRERAIYRMARIFGESEFSMSGDFARAVEAEIRDYWMAGGARRLREAIERGETAGTTPVIAQALTQAGLPLEFYYLAVQESDLKPDAVGPTTRFGRAKGMWQFIPVTAAKYGLDPGPAPNTAGTNPRDQRLDFRQASTAAASYLRDIYAELAQASGLLVMAAYNWGEHRVNPRLQNLESHTDAFEAEFADVGQSPEARNYWRFLEQYGDRMPDETKDYVLKIFSAAVLGSNPDVFGLDIEDPLAAYRQASIGAQ